jgi:hypothetical protein
MLLTFPLIVGIQIASARIGRVKGNRLAANIRRPCPPGLLCGNVSLLLAAGTLDIAVDSGSTGAALRLLPGGSAHWYAIGLGATSLEPQQFLRSALRVARNAANAALFANVRMVLVVTVPWGGVLCRAVLPAGSPQIDCAVAAVAVFAGSTILACASGRPRSRSCSSGRPRERSRCAPRPSRRGAACVASSSILTSAWPTAAWLRCSSWWRPPCRRLAADDLRSRR